MLAILGRMNLTICAFIIRILQHLRMSSSLYFGRHRHINRRHRMIQQKLEIKGLVLILALVIIVLSWEHVHATLLASGF